MHCCVFDCCGDERGEMVLKCMPGTKETAERDKIIEIKLINIKLHTNA